MKRDETIELVKTGFERLETALKEGKSAELLAYDRRSIPAFVLVVCFCSLHSDTFKTGQILFARCCSSMVSVQIRLAPEACRTNKGSAIRLS